MEFPPWPCVYAISAGRSRVKIGHSTDMAGRFSALQHASPYKLRILATMPGGVAEERWLHREFRKYRKHGEWFDLSSTNLRRLMELMACETPGRIETKPKKVASPYRSGKVKRSVVPPEVRQAAIDHVNHWFNNADLILDDREAMQHFEKVMAKKMRQAGQL